MKTVGIIGGIGPESTVEYYRGIIASYRRVRNDGSYPRIILNSINLREMLDLAVAGDMDGLARYLGDALARVAAAGADFGVFAANTPHLVFDAIKARSPIPLISIVEETARTARHNGLRKVGLFGTKFTMQSDFYSKEFAKRDISVFVPDADQRDFIHDKYMTELVDGVIMEETRNEFEDIAQTLKERNRIEGLILGGTELPLLLKDETNVGVPYLNTTRIHVDSIVRYLVSE